MDNECANGPDGMMVQVRLPVRYELKRPQANGATQSRSWIWTLSCVGVACEAAVFDPEEVENGRPMPPGSMCALWASDFAQTRTTATLRLEPGPGRCINAAEYTFAIDFERGLVDYAESSVLWEGRGQARCKPLLDVHFGSIQR